jgi:hypothetical protein
MMLREKGRTGAGHTQHEMPSMLVTEHTIPTSARQLATFSGDPAEK